MNFTDFDTTTVEGHLDLWQAVAEALGWTRLQRQQAFWETPCGNDDGWHPQLHGRRPDCDIEFEVDCPPDYVHDLTACMNALRQVWADRSLIVYFDSHENTYQAGYFDSESTARVGGAVLFDRTPISAAVACCYAILRASEAKA